MRRMVLLHSAAVEVHTEHNVELRKLASAAAAAAAYHRVSGMRSNIAVTAVVVCVILIHGCLICRHCCLLCLPLSL